MVESIGVFENPWVDRAVIHHQYKLTPTPVEVSSLIPVSSPLLTAVNGEQKHARIARRLLDVVSALERDQNGRICDRALAMSEWRYVQYLQMLTWHGQAPIDILPPWLVSPSSSFEARILTRSGRTLGRDVAVVWYCHLMSPLQFHRYLWDTGQRDYGLETRHFPLMTLYLADWIRTSDEKKWKNWSKYTGISVPYQLWPKKPWGPQPEPREKSKTGARLSAFFSRFRPNGPYSYSDIICTRLGDCGPADGTPRKIWKLDEWTSLRTGHGTGGPNVCRLVHDNGSWCAFQPFPSLETLRAAIESQVQFWRAMESALSSVKFSFQFQTWLKPAIHDYQDFIHLLRRRDSPGASWKTWFQSGIYHHPMGASGEVEKGVAPPSLQVDLMWRTHRLFPASYWEWTHLETGWLIDQVPGSDVQSCGREIEETIRIWERTYGKPPHDAVPLPVYVLARALPVLEQPGRDMPFVILRGLNPVRKWISPAGRYTGDRRAQYRGPASSAGGSNYLGGYGGYGDGGGDGGGGGGCGGGDGGGGSGG